MCARQFSAHAMRIYGICMKKTFIANIENETIEFEFEKLSDTQARLSREDQEWIFDIVAVGDNGYSLLLDGKSYHIQLNADGEQKQASLHGQGVAFSLVDKKKMRRSGALAHGESGVSGEVVSPMPGRIVKIHVGVGDEVTEGQGVIVVEAMKMENEFKAPKSGKIKDIKVKEGDSVEGNAVLVVVE